VTAFLGPSGSGKTTLLRCIAGLEPQGRGYLVFNGEVWQDSGRGLCLPTHRRPLGYVFQEASLFPHLSVRRNLDYGRRRAARLQPGPHPVSLEQVIALLGIGHLLDRMPDRLSGGERQRVAIAKAEILPYLERLHDELDMPVLYVSHAPEEVARLADHLVLIEEGHIVASGPLSETLARLDLPTGFQHDAGVVIEAEVAGHDDEDHLSRLVFGGGVLWVNRRDFPLGKKVRCRLEARDVSLALSPQEDSSILNVIAARITGWTPTDHPARVLVQLDADGTLLLARITHRSLKRLNLQVGLRVWAQIKAVVLLER